MSENKPVKPNRRLDKQLVIIIIAIIAIIVGLLYRVGYIFGNRNRDLGIEVSVDGTISYNTDALVNGALEKLNDDSFDKKAERVSGYKATQRKVSLVFAGMGTTSQMTEIKELLEDYDVKAAFMVDGMSAAEDIEIVQNLAKAGYIIGNYGLNSERYWHDIPREELLESIARTQAILRTGIDKEPKYALGNATKYSEDVLRTVACADIEKCVEPTKYLSSMSFPSFNAALGFVGQLSPGSIVCIKVNDMLDEIEFEPFEKDEKPAEDKQDSLSEKEEEVDPEKPDIVRVTEYLLEALETTETAVVSLDRIDIEPDVMINNIFLDQNKAEQLQVKENEEVNISYFDNALFIGDSLTQALYYYSDLKDVSEFCAYKSTTPVQFVNNTKAESVYGKEENMLDAVLGKHPDKIYVLLGTNALASGSTDSLISYYEKFVDTLKENFKDTEIYIQGMPPVTKEVSEKRITLTNGRIRKTNLKIAKMAKEKGLYYIDLYSAFVDKENESKALDINVAQDDGIHMNKDGCQIWVDYLKKHTVKH